MLTPAFCLTQDEEFLFLDIKAPNAKATEAQFDFDGDLFNFYSKPYFLRLHLPGEVVENGSESALWDPDKSSFLVTIPKKNRGEHFQGLDMLTKLLTPSRAQRVTKRIPNIEVISSCSFDAQNNGHEREPQSKQRDQDYEHHETGSHVGQDEEEEEGEEEWHVEQTPWREEEEEALWGERYGFASGRSGVFARLGEDLWQVIDLENPEKKTYAQRRRERVEAEAGHFDEEHYLFDLYDQQQLIDDLITYKPFWEEVRAGDSIVFNDQETYRMTSLPRKEFLKFDKAIKRSLLLGMVDMLYAYAYDIRTNQGDHSPESGWTITKLSATLSWFDAFSSLEEVALSSVRRSLCYPLYRHWRLSLKVLEDTCEIIRLGRSSVLRSFLGLQALLNESGDSRYILNDLYVTDYCVYLQTLKESTFTHLADALAKIHPEKRMVDLDLELLEGAAQLTLDEQEGDDEGLHEARALHSHLHLSTVSDQLSQISLQGTCDSPHLSWSEKSGSTSGSSSSSTSSENSVSDDYYSDEVDSSDKSVESESASEYEEAQEEADPHPDPGAEQLTSHIEKREKCR